MNSSQKNQRNKRLLLVAGLVFLAFVVYSTYDIMSRTTHPGAKKHLPNSILK
jgi:hypothetical protein